MATIYDWRRKSPEILGREVEDVKSELIGARVIDMSEYGSSVLLELRSGERVWYGAGGYEFDIELHAGDKPL